MLSHREKCMYVLFHCSVKKTNQTSHTWNNDIYWKRSLRWTTKKPKTTETDQIITVQVECRGREQTSFSVLLLWMWERCWFNTSLRHKAQVCAQFNLVLSHWGSDTAAKVSRIQRGTARAGRCHGAQLNNEAGRTVRRRAVEPMW